MAQVFDEAIDGRRFTPEQAQFMREAYLRALSALGLKSREGRLRMARTIITLYRLERFPEPEQLAALAIDWYVSGQGGAS